LLGEEYLFFSSPQELDGGLSIHLGQETSNRYLIFASLADKN